MFEDLINSLPNILNQRISERLSEIEKDDVNFQKTYRNICEEIEMELQILGDIIGVFQARMEHDSK